MKMDKKSLLAGLGLIAVALVGFFLLKPADTDPNATSSLPSPISSQPDVVTSASPASTAEPTADPTIAPTVAPTVTPTAAPTATPSPAAEYRFRNQSLLSQHYDKHGKDMGFASAAEYEQAASRVINDPSALHKLEAEDGDDIYYIEATNEFVVLAKDGYIRTYFLPDAGRAYYDRQ